MKALKYIFFVIAGLFLIFLLIGILNPTVEYGHEITVDKSIEEAWSVQQDESKFNQWLKGFQSIERISGEQGAVGSKYKIVVIPEPGQPEFIMTETLVSIKDFDHITLSMDSDMMVFDQTTSFVEKDGKTTIKTDSKVLGKGIINRSIFALMEMTAGMFQAQEVENIDNLKKVIDSNTTDYFPVSEDALKPILEEG